jgi:hypothetical protein
MKKVILSFFLDQTGRLGGQRLGLCETTPRSKKIPNSKLQNSNNKTKHSNEEIIKRSSRVKLHKRLNVKHRIPLRRETLNTER